MRIYGGNIRCPHACIHAYNFKALFLVCIPPNLVAYLGALWFWLWE